MTASGSSHDVVRGHRRCAARPRHRGRRRSPVSRRARPGRVAPRDAHAPGRCGPRRHTRRACRAIGDARSPPSPTMRPASNCSGASTTSEWTSLNLGCGGTTAEKVRIRCGEHTLLRLDRGAAEDVIGALGATARRALDEADVVLVSDYGRGITAHPGVRAALERRIGREVVWDPHPRGAPPVPRRPPGDPQPVRGGDDVRTAVRRRRAWCDRAGTAARPPLGSRRRGRDTGRTRCTPRPG